jgi:hypothetical protein
VYEGDHPAGMRLLDEALTVGLAEPAELLVCIAWAGCYLITACELVRDYDRAGQWCNTIADFYERHGIGMLLGVCRGKYAGVLAWQGRLPEAEAQVAIARDVLRSSRPTLTPMPWCGSVTSAALKPRSTWRQIRRSWPLASGWISPSAWPRAAGARPQRVRSRQRGGPSRSWVPGGARSGSWRWSGACDMARR